MGGISTLSPDRIFPTFIVHQMPHGVAGLLVAAILAAAMSNLSAALNSLASTTVIDFWLPFRTLRTAPKPFGHPERGRASAAVEGPRSLPPRHVSPSLSALCTSSPPARQTPPSSPASPPSSGRSSSSPSPSTPSTPAAKATWSRPG